MCTCIGLYTARHISIQYLSLMCFLCVCTGSFADFFPFTFDFWLASYHNYANFFNVVVILLSFFAIISIVMCYSMYVYYDGHFVTQQQEH